MTSDRKHEKRVSPFGMIPGSMNVARVKFETTKVVIMIWTITIEK